MDISTNSLFSENLITGNSFLTVEATYWRPLISPDTLQDVNIVYLSKQDAVWAFGLLNTTDQSPLAHTSSGCGAMQIFIGSFALLGYAFSSMALIGFALITL